VKVNRSRPCTVRIAAAAALLALLSAAACDESKELSKREQRVVVGAISSNICPLPDADSTVNIQATVYGLDGPLGREQVEAAEAVAVGPDVPRGREPGAARQFAIRGKAHGRTVVP
jgi:hypothetical protein